MTYRTELFALRLIDNAVHKRVDLVRVDVWVAPKVAISAKARRRVSALGCPMLDVMNNRRQVALDDVRVCALVPLCVK